MSTEHDPNENPQVAIEKLRNALVAERQLSKQHKELARQANERLKTTANVEKLNILLTDPTSAKIAEHVALMVEAEITTRNTEHFARAAQLQAELEEAKAANATIRETMETNTIRAALKEAAIAHHLLPEAIEDAVQLGLLELKVVDGNIQTAEGLDPVSWLENRKALSPFWWPVGRGSGGPNGSSSRGMDYIAHSGAPRPDHNPFAKGDHFNPMAQKYIEQMHPMLASELRAEALVEGD